MTQDKPEDWTFEKAKQEEADEDRALAVSIREEILYMRAIVDDLKVGRAAPASACFVSRHSVV